MRREVGEDLRQLIEVDQEIISVHENAPSGQGDDEGGKKKKKKDKGKEKEKWRPKTQEKKEKEDQGFLMKFVLLTAIIFRSEVTSSLHSYILNRGWIDRSAKRLPTYTEITSTRNRKTKSKAKGPGHDEGSTTDSSGRPSESEADGGSHNMIEDEDEFDDVVDVFESSYNFRFEEPYVVPPHSERTTATLIFALPTETQLKFPITRETSPQPSVVRTRHGRKLEHVERPVRKKSSSKNARKSSDSRHSKRKRSSGNLNELAERAVYRISTNIEV